MAQGGLPMASPGKASIALFAPGFSSGGAVRLGE